MNVPTYEVETVYLPIGTVVTFTKDGLLQNLTISQGMDVKLIRFVDDNVCEIVWPDADGGTALALETTK